MIGLLRSRKLWMVLAALGVVALGLYQARTIGEQRAELNSKQAVIESLGYQLEAQQRQHEQAMAARDAALQAEKTHAQQAQARAQGLAAEIRNARDAHADIDACMGLQLPDGIAERLRQ